MGCVAGSSSDIAASDQCKHRPSAPIGVPTSSDGWMPGREAHATKAAESRPTRSTKGARCSLPPTRRSSDRMAESSALAFQQSHVSAVVLARAKNLRKATKKRVLDEDDFTDVLDGIIRRDFFPDLAVLDAQHALLDALEAGDQAAATAAHRRLVPNHSGAQAAAASPRAK